MSHLRPATRLACRCLAGAALALAACTPAPPPPPAAVQAEALPGKAAPPGRWSNPADAAAVSSGWVASFRDSRLTALVNEALANNNDLKIAAARVEQARQALVVAGAPMLPVVALGGSAHTGEDLSANQDFGHRGASLSVAWEVDVWGRISAGQAAALAEYEAVAQTEAYARMSIAALVARGWFTTLGLTEQVALARRQVDTYAAQADLVAKKFAAGAVDQMDVDQADAVVSAARASLATLEARTDTAARSLEVLLGRYPANQIGKGGGLPALPGRMAAGTPAALISRRPDVAAAAQMVDAAWYQIDEAQLALLPGISLIGRGGRLDDSALGLLGYGPDYMLIGTSILQPIFAGGTLNSEIASATARQKAAVASYGQAMLNAFQEVETALANETYLRDRRSNLADERTSWADAVDLAQDKFDAGQISMQNLLQMQERLEAVEQQAIEAETDLLLNRVDLYLALGGGA